MHLRRLYGCFFLLYVITAIVGLSDRAYAANRILINGFAIDVKGEEPKVPADLNANREGGTPKWIVQFRGPIHPEEKQQLVELGCSIGDYLPDFAFMVAMDTATADTVRNLPAVEGVIRYKPAYKVDKALKDTTGAVRIEKGTLQKLHVRLDSVESRQTVISEILKRKGNILDVSGEMVRLEIDQAEIVNLAQLEQVIWVEGAADLHIMNDTTVWVLQSNQSNSTPVWGHGLHGEGQVVGISDTGLDYDMPWFRDPSAAQIGSSHRKIIGYDPTYGDDYDGNTGHGTHVAGILAGNREPVDEVTNLRGMAYKSRLFIQDLTVGEGLGVSPPADLGNLFIKAYDAGARIHSNSWGNADNAYNSYAGTADRFLWEHKDFLAFFSAGNLGPYSNSIGNPAVAKNVVSVGSSYNGASANNLAGSSSNGPTADGRIKPTVIAPGVGILSADSDGIKNSLNDGITYMSGTSMATPAAAGAAALIRQYFSEGYYPTGSPTTANAHTPSASLVKATLINSAQDMTGTYTDGLIPSSGQGWGRVNLSRSLAFAEGGKLLEIVDDTTGLSTGGAWSGSYFVTGAQPLKVTLVWTDYPAAAGAATALVNNLDLTVTGPDGATTYLGNVFAQGASQPGGSADKLNVEEQVLIKTPLKGQYVITVTGLNVPMGPQPFALAITGAAKVTANGVIVLDKGRYRFGDTVSIRVADKDLDLDQAEVDTVGVNIYSGADLAGKNVILTETGIDTGIFTGQIGVTAVSEEASSLKLQVLSDDVITAVYEDVDDGSGSHVTATATAVVDNKNPVIASVSTGSITDRSAAVTWTTDEPARSELYYARTAEELSVMLPLQEPSSSTSHSMTIRNLEEARIYYFKICATDEAGNRACNDNNGAYFQVQTGSAAPEVSVYSSQGKETFLDNTKIYGFAKDYSGIGSLTVNNDQVPVRAGDGYFEKFMQLSVGPNTISISATDNMGLVATITVTVTRLAPPDLVMSQIAALSNGITGGLMTVSDTVCNQGLGESKPFQVGLYLSSDNTFTTANIAMGRREVPALKPQDCSSGTTNVTVPIYDIGSGTYYVGAYADYAIVQFESDETNNTLIGNPVTITGPDLEPVSVWTPPAVEAGETITVSSPIRNNGPGAAGRFSVGLYFLPYGNAINAAAPSATYVVGNLAVDTLAQNTAILIPADTPIGTYQVCVKADYIDALNEENEANNVKCGSRITIGPDLQITEISAPATSLPGNSILVGTTVANTAGKGSAAAFSVGIYLHSSEGDLLLGSRVISSLVPGQSSWEATAVTIPPTVPPGDYTIRAVADITLDVNEINESNNTRDGNVIKIVSSEITNAAPAISKIVAPVAPVRIGTTINITAEFTDTSLNQTHTALWHWGDGTTSVRTVSGSGADGAELAMGEHIYDAAGVYSVSVTITDDAGGATTEKFEFVVVYDPDGAFVTGGGWFYSDPGALAADPAAEGRAVYGFVSKYQPGANVPTGTTEFQFKAGDLSFRSVSYEWLVVAGSKAMYKGSGTVNGAGTYGFLLTATDGQLKAGGEPDTLRMKIWDRETGGVVYDNQRGVDDYADPNVAIQGGNILIHKKAGI